MNELQVYCDKIKLMHIHCPGKYIHKAATQTIVIGAPSQQYKYG